MLLVSFYTHENIRKPVVLFFRAYRKRPVARKKIRLILSQKGIMREQSCLKRKRKDFSFYTPWKHQKTYFQGVETVKSGMKWVRYDFLFKMVQTQALNWPIKILQAFRYFQNLSNPKQWKYHNKLRNILQNTVSGIFKKSLKLRLRKDTRTIFWKKKLMVEYKNGLKWKSKFI